MFYAGGFDALMQAAVCRQHIGWRDQARRLLVFSTDAGYHHAGDGRVCSIFEIMFKPWGCICNYFQIEVAQVLWRLSLNWYVLLCLQLGGIIAPNDGECHMNSNGEYTHSSILDYPSISQINAKVKENAINVIFAVAADQISDYEKLSKYIEGSTIAQLSENSSNVVELVKEQYSVCALFFIF